MPLAGPERLRVLVTQGGEAGPSATSGRFGGCRPLRAPLRSTPRVHRRSSPVHLDLTALKSGKAAHRPPAHRVENADRPQQDEGHHDRDLNRSTHGHPGQIGTPGEPSADQSGVGRSTESITSTGMGARVRSVLRPSCSLRAAANVGRLRFGGASNTGLIAAVKKMLYRH